MKLTGEKLRNLREQKGVELDEVVQATKIKMSTLKAMEEGDLKQLPSKTFIRGFVQSYVRYLGVEEQDVLDTFHEEMGSTVDIPKHTDEKVDSGSDSDAMKFANSTRHPLIKIFVGVGAIVLLALIYFVSSTIDKYQEEKQLVKPTQEEAQNLVPIEEDVADQDEQVIEEASPKPNETAPQNNANETEKKKIVEEPKEVVAPVKKQPVDKPKPEPAPKPTVEEKKPVAKLEPKKEEEKLPEPKAEKPAPKAEKIEEVVEPKKVVARFVPQEVIIEALDKVEVEFRTDEGTWVELELQPEQIHTIKGKEKIDLRIADGGAVNIIYNGKDKGVPGTLGSKAEVSYPQ